MLQGQTAWSYSHIHDHPPSTELQLYLLFLLAAGMVGIVKLLIVWWAAPPFRLPRVKDRPAYVQKLAATAASLQRWIADILQLGSAGFFQCRRCWATPSGAAGALGRFYHPNRDHVLFEGPY